MRILILKPSSLGDIVNALPVLRALRQAYPHGEIYWWVFSEFTPLLADDPDLTGLIEFERRGWFNRSVLRRALTTLLRLRAQRFDLVLDLQGLFRSAAFGWLVNGRLHIGLSDSGEGAAAFFDVPIARPSVDTHAVDYCLEALRAVQVGRARHFEWLPVRREAQAAVLQQQPVGDGRLVAISPGARWANKLWPLQHFRSLVERLAREFADLRFVILGSGADAEICHAIAQVEPQRCRDLAGRTPLPALVEWLRASQLLVTNDSGPMHIAAALGTPVVAMFGPTAPRRTGPYGQQGRVLQLPLSCVPCLKSRCANSRPVECLQDLSPDAVFREAARWLERERPPCGVSTR